MSETPSNPVEDVIVVGAGPTGLMLARELALAGVQCRVLERRGEPSSESRALGIQARTLEILEMRGIAEEVVSEGNPIRKVRLSIGNSLLNLDRLDTRFGQLHITPQSRTERILERHARPLGVSVERDTEVLEVKQHADHVVLRVRSGERVWEERARWVVGCDGAHSVVRSSQGIEFPGKTYPYTIVVADVRLKREPKDPLRITVGGHGLVVSTDFGDGFFRMGAIDREKPWSEDPVGLEEVRVTLTTMFGHDLGPSDPLWTSRFRIQERQASTYRSGRVLVAGDAAHVHSPLGGQGLNLGLQDAMNLGWKLASVIKGHAHPELLDTYATERRRVSTMVIKATDIATRVMTSGKLPPRVLRSIVIPVALRLPRSHLALAGGLSGISVRYPPTGKRKRRSLPMPWRKRAADADEIAGTRMPDIEILRPDGESGTLFPLMRDGRFILIDQTGDVPPETTEPWAARVVTVTGRVAHPAFAGHPVILSRPDGYCAWAGTPGDLEGLTSALNSWCGSGALLPG